MKKLIITFVVALSLSGCSDFLVERQSTSYEGTAMIGSKSALESSVLGIHRQFASSGFKSGNFCEFLAPASGLAIWGHTNALTHPQEKWLSLHKYTRFSRHPESVVSFESFYKTIYLCNHLLNLMENSPVDKGYVDEIRGEIHFLRAMSYFYLVRFFGDVTLSLDTPASSEDETMYKPRENFYTVYCQILDDLDYAVENMRSFDEMVSRSGGSIDASGNVRTGNASGRVCDYAAISCRSLVYLTIGSLLRAVENDPDDNFWTSDRTPAMMAAFADKEIESADDAFALALKDADDVLQNGPFVLCPDYRQLFRWTESEDWQLRERIWAMPRSPESKDAGSGLTLWALPRCYNGSENVDNFGRCRPDRWFFQKWCEKYGGVYGKGQNNEDIYVDCADPRMGVNLVYGSFKGRDNKTEVCYPSDSRINISSASMMKSFGIPFYKKYYDPTFNNSDGNADLYVMRLAEVYLIAAEATAELYYKGANEFGKTAMDYVNVLLDRARRSTDGGPSAEPADWKAADFDSKEKLLDAIFWERCFEMPFEHHEYFDTHRHGARWIVRNISEPKNRFLYLDGQNDHVAEGKEYTGYRTIYYGEDFLYDTDPALVRKGLICGYPYDEIVYNPRLDEMSQDVLTGQNPAEVFWR